jgi:hypothetical protein
MTKLILLGLTMFFLVACSTTEVPSGSAASNKSTCNLQEKPLFLHLLSSGTPPGTPAHRIASVRIYLSQDFSISFGNPDNPFTNRWDGAVTLARRSPNGAYEKRPLENLWDSGDAVLAGRVDKKDGKLFAKIQGRNRTTLNYIDGEIELEKPVEQDGSWFCGGAIWGVWFVLSENPDCSPFLRALDEGTLHSPSTVEANSPEAKQWLQSNEPPHENDKSKIHR